MDENLWPDRQQCVDGQEGEDGGQERTATSEEMLVLKLPHYLQQAAYNFHCFLCLY